MRVDSKFDNMMSSKTEEEIVHLMLLTSFMIEEYTTWTINNRDKSRNTWWRAEEYARHDKHSTRGWKTSNWRNQLQFNADGQDTYSLLLRTIKKKKKKPGHTAGKKTSWSNMPVHCLGATITLNAKGLSTLGMKTVWWYNINTFLE